MDYFLRFAASGTVPASWFLPDFPPLEKRRSFSGELNIEIVSHCWLYGHMLVYQLSSLINYPPTNCQVTMTVFYCEEDTRTRELLNYFSGIQKANIRWNWQALPREQLFRRGIGRNYAARETQADWIWFTDCDLIFHKGCLDDLCQQLQNRRDALVFPKFERCTSLLTNEDPMLTVDPGNIQILDINTQKFTLNERTRATGPLQITHGDIARHCGYCECLPLYQTPANTWCKAREDRAFRWLLRTQGTALDIKGVYRIRHVYKGRYSGGKVSTGMRSRIRRIKSWISEKLGLTRPKKSQGT